MKRHYNIPVFLPHAACPFRCVFCDQHLITARQTLPTPQEAADIIHRNLTTIPPDAEVEIAFFGGSFTALPLTEQEAYLAAARPFLAGGRVKSLRISTRPDCLSEEIFALLRRYDVRVIELGIQSFDDDVLRASGRGYPAAAAEQGCRAVQEAGFTLGVQLMPGLPGDTPEKSVNAAKKAVALGAKMARIYPTVVLKGTALARMADQGRYTPLTVPEAVETAARMRMVLDAAGIPVIRVGLYVGEELQNPENVRGGAYHSALGELVEQRIFAWQTERLLEMLPPGEKPAVFFVSPRDVSKFVGFTGENKRKLQAKYGTMKLRTLPEENTGWVGIALHPGARQPEYLLSRAEFLEGAAATASRQS